MDNYPFINSCGVNCYILHRNLWNTLDTWNFRFYLIFNRMYVLYRSWRNLRIFHLQTIPYSPMAVTTIRHHLNRRPT